MAVGALHTGALHTAVFMGHTTIVAAIGQAVVAAEGEMAAGDIGAETAAAVTTHRR
jgi:hypothetical protein